MPGIVHTDRGDTIIEVLFAMTVFSLVAVGSLSLMNQGTAMAQRALEIEHVRQQMEAQADALRYLNRGLITDFGRGGEASKRWNAILDPSTDRVVAQAQSFQDVVQSGECNVPQGAFAIDYERLEQGEPPAELPLLSPQAETVTYAKVNYDNESGSAPPPRAEGIWVQAVKVDDPRPRTDSNNPARPGFYDFHIRACWQTPGQDTPIKLGTIVRLYEPRF